MHRRRDFKQGDPAWDVLEAQWMAQLAGGGAQAGAALDALVLVYGALFVKRLCFFGLSIEDAQDVAQDLWMKVARVAPSYRGEAPVRSFLHGVLKQAKLNHYSEHYKRPPLDSTSDELVAASMELAMQALGPTTAQADGWADFDLLRCVRRAFAAFEQKHPRLASLLLLRHVEEMSLEEIAARVGGRPEEAKAEVFSARNKFRPDVKPCLGLWTDRGREKRGDDDESR